MTLEAHQMEMEVQQTIQKMAKAMQEQLVLSDPFPVHHGDRLKIRAPDPMLTMSDIERIKRKTLLDEAIVEAEKAPKKGLKLPKWMRFGKESS